MIPESSAVGRSPVCVITGGEGTLAGEIRRVFTGEKWRVLAPGRSELDVTRSAMVSRYFASLAHVDLLIHSAAIADDGLLVMQSSNDRDRVLDTTLRGGFLCARAVVPLMQQALCGHILFVGSWTGQHGGIGQTAYAAAKAGLIGLTKSLAAELAGFNIRVNALLPGWMDTKMTARLPASARKRALKAHVLGRFNSPNDAARTAFFMHSLAHVSGQVFQTDSRL